MKISTLSYILLHLKLKWIAYWRVGPWMSTLAQSGQTWSWNNWKHCTGKEKLNDCLQAIEGRKRDNWLGKAVQEN